jgi:hypothetical protein
MPKESIYLKAQGEVSIGDFRTVVDAFVDLLSAITSDVAPRQAGVQWIISKLESGSCIIESRGIGRDYASKFTVGLVVERYEAVVQAAHFGRIDKFSEDIQDPLRRMASVIDGGTVSDILMGPDASNLVAVDPAIGEGKPASDSPMGLQRYTRTAIKGQVVTLDQKRGTYFTLRQAYTNRNIRCYLTEDQQQYKARLGGLWTRGTWILVEGTFARHGDVQTIYHITDLVELDDVEPGSWRQAVGCAPRSPEGAGKNPVDAVRKVRDGDGQ